MNDLAGLVAGPAGAATADPSAWIWRAVAGGVGALAVLALLCAAVVLLRRRELGLVERRLAVIVAVFLAASLVAQLALALPPWRPDGAVVTVGLVAAAVALLAAALAWWELPKHFAQPPIGELARSNAALASASAGLEADLARRMSELQQTRQRLDLALSSSKITLFSQDADLRYTWLQNPRPGLTPETAGATWLESEPSDALAMKREVLATGRTRSGGVSVADGRGGASHFDVTIIPMPGAGGAINGVLCTAVDVTERRQFDVRLASMAAQAAAAYRKFQLALEDSTITVFEQDAALRYTFMHNPPPGTEPEDFLGRTDADLFGESDLRKLEPLKRRVIETGARDAMEIELEVGGARRFYALRLEPQISEAGAVEGVIGTALDLTERRRHEQSMKLVMRELTHRSKNLLAVVQAMARKTASAAPDTDTFIRDFSSRLRAIAAAHDLLVAESWSGAELRSLLAASLSQTVDPDAPEIRVEGPSLKLAPDAAQMLGLAFHELTMNAAKHGSLSVAGGRIAVLWRRDGDAVRLCWREEGGPAVVPPERSGFGRVLLERLVGAALGGAVVLDFRPEGLVCDLSFPEDRLIAA